MAKYILVLDVVVYNNNLLSLKRILNFLVTIVTPKLIDMKRMLGPRNINNKYLFTHPAF